MPYHQQMAQLAAENAVSSIKNAILKVADFDYNSNTVNI